MATAILELGEGEYQVVKDGRLYLRTSDGDRPIDLPPDQDFDLYIRAAVAKWGLRRMLDDAGNFGIEIGDELPKTKIIELADGEAVSVLDK
jgi:hypothetical protein